MGNFRIIDAPQRSDEWFKARLGRLTGSRAADMCATIKSGEAAARRNLRVQLVLERLTGRSQESTYQSPAMTQGIEREADAVAVYEAVAGRLLQTTGFLQHPSLMAGCSLDGHVGDFEGIVEVKCPIAATHLEYLRSGVIPDNYLKQIIHGLWITGAAWCDWLSYNPDFPEPLQVRLVRLERNETQMLLWEGLAKQFLAECDKEYAEVDHMAGVPF